MNRAKGSGRVGFGEKFSRFESTTWQPRCCPLRRKRLTLLQAVFNHWQGVGGSEPTRNRSGKHSDLLGAFMIMFMIIRPLIFCNHASRTHPGRFVNQTQHQYVLLGLSSELQICRESDCTRGAHIICIQPVTLIE